MVRETLAIRALDAILPGDGIPLLGDLAPLRNLYSAIGPEMPEDLMSSPVTTDLPHAPKVLHFNYDEGHAGRISVPGTAGGSLDLSWALNLPAPAEYIRSNLAFRPKGVKPLQEGDLVFFVPGMNTLHEPASGETTAIDRIEHYVRVLGSVHMAQIHVGTSFDQGDAIIHAARAPLLLALLSGGMLPGSALPSEVGDQEGDLVFRGRQIDNVQVALSEHNAIDTPVKKSIRQLLATTEEALAPGFVLMVYSRGAIECEAALKRYKDEAGGTEAEIEERLRERVTVVTVGSASHDFPDGPAYVHLAAWSDPLSSERGVTGRNRAEKGGKDAVFLNCPSPYHEDAFDNHNFGALTAQFLSLVLAKSGAKGLRELWEMGNEGRMVVPDDTDRVLRAMIMMTRGFEWLWSTGEAWKNIPMGALPTADDAEGILRREIGDEFVEMVLLNFPSKSR